MTLPFLSVESLTPVLLRISHWLRCCFGTQYRKGPWLCGTEKRNTLSENFGLVLVLRIKLESTFGSYGSSLPSSTATSPSRRVHAPDLLSADGFHITPVHSSRSSQSPVHVV